MIKLNSKETKNLKAVLEEDIVRIKLTHNTPLKQGKKQISELIKEINLTGYDRFDNPAEKIVIKDWIEAHENEIYNSMPSEPNDIVWGSPWRLHSLFEQLDLKTNIPESIVTRILDDRDILDDWLHTQYYGINSKPWATNKLAKGIAEEHDIELDPENEALMDFISA